MTVEDASNGLFLWFEKNDSFEINRDLKKVVPIVDNEEEAVVAFKVALENCEKMELLASREYGDKRFYVLQKHMDSYQQNVEIGPWSAKFLGNEINEFCTLVEDNTDLCQTSAIGEKDIRNLVHIIHFYKQKLIEKEQIIAGGPQPQADPLLQAFNAGPPPQEEAPPDDEDEDPSGKKKKK